MSDREEIMDLIRNEYDPAPSHYRMGDNWDDGAGRIADAILADRTIVERRHAEEIEQLRRQLAAVRETLAGSDISSLPNDYSVERMAVDWMTDLARGVAQAVDGPNPLRVAMARAIDLLTERTYGSPARSPGHNARLVLEVALATSPLSSAVRKWDEPDYEGTGVDTKRAVDRFDAERGGK